MSELGNNGRRTDMSENVQGNFDPVPTRHILIPEVNYST